MRLCFWIMPLIILLTMPDSSNAQTPNPNIRVYGYLATWALKMNMGASNYENCLYTDIDWDACTDYITFSTSFTADGTMALANWTDWATGGKTSWDSPYFTLQKRRILNDNIHSKGKPVQCCIFVRGGGDTWSNLLSTQSGRNAMIKTIVDSIIGPANRYDGVHFDPEPFDPVDTANARIFFAQLRDTLNKYHQWVDVRKKPEMSVAIYGVWCGRYWASVSQYFDAILHMSYNMFGSWEKITWYNAPVYSTGYGGSSYNVASIKDYIDTYTKAGIPRNKLVMGCPFNYNAYIGGSTTGGEGCYTPLLTGAWVDDTNFPILNLASNSEMYYLAWNKWIDTATTTLHRDTIRCAAWVGYNKPGSATDELVLFQDTFCVRKNLELLSAEGLQGAMVWEIPGAYINNLDQTRHPGLANDHLLQAVKKTRLRLLGDIMSTAKENSRPLEFILKQNYPNPFNPSTTISYQLSVSSYVNLKVFDMLGREVVTLVDKAEPPGNYIIPWNGSSMPSGLYFYRITAQPQGKRSFIQVKKMLLLK
jgi:GH18 family chitinase